jgi:DNA-directed RNA polymerase-5 subunit 1
VERQLISSHRGTVNLQLGNDSMVAMQLRFSRTISSKRLANQLAIFIPLKSAILINLETSTTSADPCP